MDVDAGPGRGDVQGGERGSDHDSPDLAARAMKEPAWGLDGDDVGAVEDAEPVTTDIDMPEARVQGGWTTAVGSGEGGEEDDDWD